MKSALLQSSRQLHHKAHYKAHGGDRTHLLAYSTSFHGNSEPLNLNKLPTFL
ncbi:hypothetical protein ACKFKG_04630 [Phormidesmis sp. 146-35]